jgi:hypothetical protein
MSRLRKLAWRVQRVVGGPTTRLFFVRGHPRSGTNWVGALLNLHPGVLCLGEFHFEELRRAVDSLKSQSWHITGQEPLRTELELGLQDMVRRCMTAFRDRKPGAAWIGDRTPRPMNPLLPGAPAFLVVRDGRDVLVSWTFHILRQAPDVIRAVVPAPFRDRFRLAAERFASDPNCYRDRPAELLADEGWVRHASRVWSDWVTRDRHAADLMRSGEIDGSACVIRYESLRADAEGGRRAMYEFLGLDPAEAAPLSGETNTTPGFGREDATSFYRHGEVGDWRVYAHDSMKRWFKEEAGQALIDLEYEKDLNW